MPTWTTYTKNTKTLWAAKGIHSSRKYEIKVQQLDMQLRAALANHSRRTYGVVVSNTDMATDKAVDHTDTNTRKMEELVASLKEGLTDKEVESLLVKALENRVDNSRRLLKAQLKAQALLG